MAKKLFEVLIDFEYPDTADEFSSTTSMISEVVKIIEAGAAENSFDVSHTSAGAAGAESLFELVEQ